MRYFDAVASGRFKRIDGQWAYYPWGEREGYLLPAREDYWRMHAWTARLIANFVLLTAGVWILIGPLSVAVVGVPAFAWYRRRLRQGLSGLKTTPVRLGFLESYEARAEAHSWRALWLTAAASLIALSMTAAAGVLKPEVRVSAIILAPWLAGLFAGSCMMMRSKLRVEDAASSPAQKGAL